MVAGNTLTDPIVIDELDQYGNLVTADNRTVVTASLASGSGTLLGTTQVTVRGGIATFNDLQDDTAGTLTIQFSAGTLPPVTSAPSTVTPAAASKLAIVGRPPGGIPAGSRIALVIDAMDPFGNVDTSYGEPVTVALASGSVGSLNGTLTVTASAGVASFTDLSDTTSGSISIGATSGILSTGSAGSTTVNLSPATASKLVIQAQPPQTATAGQPFATTNQAFSVLEEDQYGNVEMGDNTTGVTANLASGAGLLQGTLVATLTGGAAAFTDLYDDAAGTIALVFTGGGLTSATSGPIVISPAAASQLVIQTQPSHTATAGKAFAAQPVIAEEDQYNNIETGDDSTSVSASLARGTGPLLGRTPVTLEGGVATFTGLFDKTAETITLTFTGGGLTSPTSNPIVVSPDAASQLVIHTQPSPEATAGQALAAPPVLYEEDEYGNLETGDNSTVVTVSPSGGAGPLVGTTATVSGGVASFTSLANDKAETLSLAFSSGGLTVNSSTRIVVSPAAATMLVIQTQPSTTATAGQAFAIQPVIEVEDRYGNLEVGDESTVVTASVESGTGPLQGTTTATVSNGIATFSDLAEDVAGTITLEFIGGSLTSSVSSAVNVSAAPATKLAVTTPPPSSLVAGQAFTLVVSAEDAYGNLDTAFNGSVTISLPDEPGFPATVQARNGVAAFAGLTVGPAAQGAPIQVSGGGLTSASTGPVNVTALPAPTITGEVVVVSQKRNKKGKPVGKPLLQGFTLKYSTAMNAATAGSSANYVVDSTTTKRVKKKKITSLNPVAFTAAYNTATNSVTLTLTGKEAFATGGQIKVNYSAPGGVSSATGVDLNANDATFTIQPKGTAIAPG